MKHLRLLLLLLCFLRTSVSEKSSLTFIDLISGIVSNAQYLEENLIRSKTFFNRTWPWVDLHRLTDINGSNCTQDLRIFAQDLAIDQTWAWKTLDAWGKLPSGVMRGNLFWLGSIDECQHHLRGLNNTLVEQPFLTRTCIINDGWKSRPVYGMCVPQSCRAEDIVQLINQYALRVPLLHVSNDSVRCLDSRPYDTKAILTIVLLSLIVALILLITCWHLIHREKVPHSSDSSMTTHTITQTEITTTTVQTDAPDEATPLVTTTHQERPAERLTVWMKIRSTGGAMPQLMQYGSLIHNCKALFSERQPRNLACLNGIRVLSLCWVILAHTVMFAAWFSDNALLVINWSRRLWFQIIVQAVFSIDSFFVLSGLLTSFTFFIAKVENERFSVLKFLVNHYVYRYLRYTVFYAIILLIYITLSPYLGQGGPIYPIDGTESSACRRTWWRNLLYINNFFSTRDSCLGITWFLAVNMQFHWIAPLFLLGVFWKWFAGALVASIFILIDIISTSVIVSKNNYEYGILSDFYGNHSNSTRNYMEDVYIKPWCRLAPYAVGLLLGHSLYVLHQRSATVTWEALLPNRHPRQGRQWKSVLAWLVALSILSLCVFGTYGDFSGHPLTRSGRITFLALSRLGWAIGLSMIIITCFLGYGGLINRCLSHRIFEPLAKLTYGAYLWHELVLVVNYLGREQANHYSLPNMIFNCLIHILITYTLAFFTFLFIELPIIQLLKNIFKRSNHVH